MYTLQHTLCTPLKDEKCIEGEMCSSSFKTRTKEKCILKYKINFPLA